jgi:hypothetical protein
VGSEPAAHPRQVAGLRRRCSNRDYEGDISAFGDTVHIEQIGDPTITAYTRNTNLSVPEALTDAEQLLLIDQAKSFNFQVDDLDAAQVRNDGARR